MVQEELSLQEYSFPNVVNTSERNFPENDQPSDVDLTSCFYAFFQREQSSSQDIYQPDPLKTPEENRHEVLKKSLLKLSTLDIAGKEHLEDYLQVSALFPLQNSSLF